MENQENQKPNEAEQAPQAEAQPEAEKKEASVAAAPRHQGKAVIKKPKSFAEIEAKKQLESVKLWSKEVLEAQVASKNCSKEMKEACQAELDKRYKKK